MHDRFRLALPFSWKSFYGKEIPTSADCQIQNFVHLEISSASSKNSQFEN